MSANSNVARSARENRDVPLCVDLDGTLIRSDLLVEGFLRCLKANILFALFSLRWLIKGKARFKAEIARRATINVALLPVNTEFVAWLRQQHTEGRQLVLCTAASCEIANEVAAHFGIFAETICSSPSMNLSGRSKAALLEERYGKEGFDYAGNEVADIHVWNNARRSIVVAPTPALHRRLAKVPRVDRTFVRAGKGNAKLWIRALRLHQWAKNLLIFVPAFASHRALEPEIAGASILAFLWFGLCASATYVVNDLLDLDADRAHSRKHTRPFAAVDLPLVNGIVGAASLLVIAFVGAAVTLGPLFVGVLFIYLVGTLWYSFALKQIAMVDVLTLAGLYTVRVIAGSAAVAIAPSFWVLAFSMFLFLSLAVVKRYTELRSALAAGRSRAAGRGYTTEDLPLLLSCGTSSGFVAVMVLALYINLGSADLYHFPHALWLVCPLMLYWICRVWRKTSRGELYDDPVVFAIKDKPSLAVACMCAILMWIAI